MFSDEEQLLVDVNRIREIAGVPGYTRLPDTGDPGRTSLEYLFGSDAIYINRDVIQWVVIDWYDLEEDAMPQYEVKVVRELATPQSLRDFYAAR